MITIDEMQDMLEKLAEEIPEPFYEGLNGGVLLLPDTELSPEAKDNDLYTLGKYFYSPSMGRYIAIYYGSFSELFADETRDFIEEQLRETLFHEFTHHVEDMAGERGLDIKDQQELAEYLGDESGMYISPVLKKRRIHKKL